MLTHCIFHPIPLPQQDRLFRFDKNKISQQMFILLCLICCQLSLSMSIQTSYPRLLYDEPSNMISTISEIDCLKNVIRLIFKKPDTPLVTIPVTWMALESYDIQNEVIKYLNSQENWTIEILSEPPHSEFESSEICENVLTETVTLVKICQRNFVLKKPTDYYVIVFDDLYQFDEQLYSVYNSTSFNPSAEVIVYFHRLDNTTTSELVPILQKYLIFTSILIDHEVETNLSQVFVLQLKLGEARPCLDGIRFVSAGICPREGNFPRLYNLMRYRFPKNLKNCTIQGIAMRYEPFVITKDLGIEIKLLQVMSQQINATINMIVTMKSEDWGDKVNGTWMGNFAEIFDSFKIGIGNVGPEADRILDFDFTFSYFSATLIWVVPIAEYVKKWRVLTMIFTFDLWAITFGVFILIGVSFMILSRVCEDVSYLKSSSGSFISSLQILIASSVYNTPKTDMVRLIFSAGLIFSLIIGCVYTSSLINVLTSVVRDQQIDTVEEILQSDLKIGGLEEYRERFKNPDDDGCADEVCRRYEFVPDENDTAQIWLKMVEQRIACTPLPKFFVQFYMVKTYNRLENRATETENSLYEESKKVKLFIIEKPINTYPIAIVMKKGNPLKRRFDKFLKKFVEAGLVYTLTAKFTERFQQLEYLIENADDGPEKLSVYHLQGAFAVILLGYIAAFLTLVVEKIYRKKSENLEKAIISPVKIIQLNPTNRKCYVDKTYGNMYGKTYPSTLHNRSIYSVNNPLYFNNKNNM